MLHFSDLYSKFPGKHFHFQLMWQLPTTYVYVCSHYGAPLENKYLWAGDRSTCERWLVSTTGEVEITSKFTFGFGRSRLGVKTPMHWASFVTFKHKNSPQVWISLVNGRQTPNEKSITRVSMKAAVWRTLFLRLRCIMCRGNDKGTQTLFLFLFSLSFSLSSLFLWDQFLGHLVSPVWRNSTLTMKP